MRRQLLGQVLGQLAGGLLVAEGLDQDRAVFGMATPLPLHRAAILLAVDEGRGVPGSVEREVLDVDPGVRKMEIGLVLAPLRCCRVLCSYSASYS